MWDVMYRVTRRQVQARVDVKYRTVWYGRRSVTWSESFWVVTFWAPLYNMLSYWYILHSFWTIICTLSSQTVQPFQPVLLLYSLGLFEATTPLLYKLCLFWTHNTLYVQITLLSQLCSLRMTSTPITYPVPLLYSSSVQPAPLTGNLCSLFGCNLRPVC